MRRTLVLGLVAAVGVAPTARAQDKARSFEEDVLRDPLVAEHMLGAGWAEVDRAIELRDSDEAALDAAAKWHRGSDTTLPEQGHDGRVVYEYGSTMPRVICAPLRVCNIEMQVGEVVFDTSAGDDKRWIITGVDAAPRQYVTVKPKVQNLTTNLTIYTDRRVYLIELVSTADEHATYTPLISFTYPEEQRAQWARLRARAEERRTAAESDGKGAAGREAGEYELRVRPGSLHFGYSIEKAGRWLNRRRTKWTPLRVYDDGEKTFIEMPRRMQETPVLVVRDGGQNAIVNVRWKGSVMIVDRLFDKALLLLGAGWYQQRVAIKREKE